ncbi:hypothetical protein HanPSC8_Chr15g0692921 [Helianthus annuus]|nr:hypothetical protein HanPSC8_Chr15g0692921 [Helianthus annuus]
MFVTGAPSSSATPSSFLKKLTNCWYCLLVNLGIGLSSPSTQAAFGLTLSCFPFPGHHSG